MADFGRLVVYELGKEWAGQPAVRVLVRDEAQKLNVEGPEQTSNTMARSLNFRESESEAASRHRSWAREPWAFSLAVPSSEGDREAFS